MQILNLSIDIQNFQPPEPKNSLCYFNEMNSVVELITEQLITKRDTFPERNNQNNDGAQTHKHANITTFFPAERFANEIEELTYLSHNTYLPVTVGFIYTEIQSPPPKSC